MGQLSSKDRHKKDRKFSRKDSTLRVPAYNGSFGRSYKLKTYDGVLILPADNGVRNKFHSAPRSRPRSDNSSSTGVIVYSTSDNGQPMARVQHRPQTRPTVQHVFDDRYREQPNHHQPQREHESHNTNIKSPDQGNKTTKFNTYRAYNKMTVAEMNGRKTVSKAQGRKAEAEVHVTQQKKSSSAPRRRVENHKVQRHVPDDGSKSIPNRPPFVPPWGTKSDLVPNARMFEAIDAHAIKCPQSACSSLRSLATYLTKSAKNDLMRIRVIYRWIVHNIKYDMNAVLSGTYKSIPCDPPTVLQTRRADCQGFANLFAALCRQVDLMVKILTGFSKDFLYNPEQPFQHYEDCNHAWNIVYVHGEWRPIDCTWASGYIDDHNQFRARFNDFYFLTDPDKFVLSHFPFLAEGIKSSLQYQLLARPLSLEDFNNKISPSQSAMEWGLELLTHNENLIQVHRCVKIEFRVRRVKLKDVACRMKNVRTGDECDRFVVARRKQDGSFSVSVYPPEEGTYRLRIYGYPFGTNSVCLDSLVSYTLQCFSSISRIQPYPENQGLWGVKVDAERYGFTRDIYKQDFFVSDSGALEFKVDMRKNTTTMLKLQHAVHDIPDLSDYVTTEYSFSGMRVKARFPKPGYYKLSLLAKPPGTENNKVDLIADYLVHCKTASPNCQPFPKSFPFAQECMSILVEPQSGWLPAQKTVNFMIKSALLQRVLVDGKGAPPVTSCVFRGEIEPKPEGTQISIFGNMDGGMDHDELYRFTVIDTRLSVML